MKKLILACITAAAFWGAPALAVAKPHKAPPPPPPPPVQSWTGFYVGGTAGGTWGSFSPTTSTTVSGPSFYSAAQIGPMNAAGIQSINPSSFTGGFEAGYNWQTANYVLGIEGDIESFRLSGSATSGPIVIPLTLGNTSTTNSNASTSWLATARGRLGVVFNNWLFFATGGAAFTHQSGNFTFTDTFGSAVSASISATKVGGTVGGGIEVGLQQGWTIKAEYLYVDFGKETVGEGTCTFGGAPCALLLGNPFTHSIDLKANIVRAGLNYHF